MERTKTFSWKTAEGCQRLIAVFIAALLVFGFLGSLFQSDFGRVKVEHIDVDFRGAALNGELYYPAGTSSHDSLPAIVVAHGGANTYGTTKNIASELARRGFVVFNFSAYAQGMSEQPYYDDSDQGANGLNIVKTPAGVYDAVNYVRSMKFVDATRVGLYGHSMGSYRADFTMIQDCGYFTLNDIMVNILHDTFAQRFTADEIYKNADSLAKERLTHDQLAHYYTLRDIEAKRYNTAVKSVCIMGIDHAAGNDPQTVTVAGHDVVRSIQTNVAFINGEFDEFLFSIGLNDSQKAAWYSPDENLVRGSWYALKDRTTSNTSIGTLFKSSVTDNEQLAAAVADRTARVYYDTNNEDHVKETMSVRILSAMNDYFSQTLEYNRGSLYDPATVPLSTTNAIFPWRVIFNTITVLLMVGLLLALAGLLITTRVFAPASIPEETIKRPVFTKTQYWLYSAVLFVVAFLALFIANRHALRLGWFCDKQAWPLSRPASVTFMFLTILSIGVIVTTGMYALMRKLRNQVTGIAALNIATGFGNILKYLGIGLILLIAGYAVNSTLEYLFGQDLRIWQTVFNEMKVENWVLLLKYALVLLPLFLVVSAGINFMVRMDIREGKDTAITVLMNTLPIWLLLAVTFITAVSTPFNGRFFSDFLCSYSFLSLIPILTYINRRMYKMTNSIWASAFVCTLLVAWMMTSSLGTGDIYYSQNWLSNLLGS